MCVCVGGEREYQEELVLEKVTNYKNKLLCLNDFKQQQQKKTHNNLPEYFRQEVKSLLVLGVGNSLDVCIFFKFPTSSIYCVFFKL